MKLNNKLKDKLEIMNKVIINSNKNCIPHILNFSIIGKNPNQIQEKLSKKGILMGLPVEDKILWCATELNDKQDIDNLINAIKEVI